MTDIHTIAKLYNQLTSKLSLKQYTKLMGGDMSYRSKAERAKLVSKSKQVHILADIIINLDKIVNKRN